MKTSESTKEIFTALAKAQSEIDTIAKDTQGFGYKYAELSDILTVIRPVFASAQLVIMQTPYVEIGVMFLITRIGHASGEWVEGLTPMYFMENKKTNKMQALGASITYARRYGLCALISIGLEDDDAKSSDDKEERIEREPQRQLPPPAEPLLEEHYLMLLNDIKLCTSREGFGDLYKQVKSYSENMTKAQRLEINEAIILAKERFNIK